MGLVECHYHCTYAWIPQLALHTTLLETYGLGCHGQVGDLCVPLLRLSVLQLDLILHVLHDGTAVTTYTLDTVPAEDRADWQKQVRDSHLVHET